MSGCQSAAGRTCRGEPESAGGQLACRVSPGWQPGGRVSQAGRHPIAPLSAELTMDQHYLPRGGTRKMIDFSIKSDINVNFSD